MNLARGIGATFLLGLALGGCAMSGEAGRDRWESDLAPSIITTPDIAEGKPPILWVVHEPYPFGWVFYGANTDLGLRPAMLAKVEALRIDPNYPDAARFLGEALRQNGEPPETKQDLEKQP